MFDSLMTELSGGFSVVPIEVAMLRLMAAILLGGLIGFEREYRGKSAGLRTHMLVSLAACLFIVVGQELATLPFTGADRTQVDPLRLIEAVTAGVAFLAAGLIFTSGGKVRNITTGASMWLAGAIGLSCGAGEVPLAAMAAVLVVCVIALLGWVERRWTPDDDAVPDDD